MPRLRTLVFVALAASVAAGCGSAATSPPATSPGTSPTTSTTAPVPDKPLNHLVSAAIGALRGAKSVHLSASSSVGGSGNFAVFSGGSGYGETTVPLSSGTAQLQVVEVGANVYVRGPVRFWESLESRHGQFGSAELATLTSHWVLVPAGTEGGVISTILSTTEQFLGLLASDGGLKAMGSATVLGQQATGVRGSVGGLVLWVASHGVPYPIELTGTSPRTLFTFSDWNTGTAPGRPAGAVALPGS